MSRTDPTLVEATALEHVTCTYCGARPGEWCRRVRRFNGERYATVGWPGPMPPYADALHQPRTGPIQRIHSIGYCSGQADAAYGMEQEITSPSYYGPSRLTTLEKVVARCQELHAMWSQYAEKDR